jgi:hypothetical protein
MIKEPYSAKHKDASEDYKAAYDLVNTLEVGSGALHSAQNNKRFRKYLYDLALKQNKEIATRKRGENSLFITRIS